MPQSNETSIQSLLALRGAGPLGCAICHTQFTTPEERIQHARDKHNVHKSKFPCTACNLTGFSSLSYLQNHMRTKCLGFGWETRLVKKSEDDNLPSPLSHDKKVQSLSEDTFKRDRSNSSSIDSSESKQTRRPSLRSCKPENTGNGEANTQDISKSSTLTTIDESIAVSSSLPPRKRRMSTTVEKLAKIPRKDVQSVEHVSENIASESTRNDETSMRKKRRNSSSDLKPEATQLMKSGKSTYFSDENAVNDAADKILRNELELADAVGDHTQVTVGKSNLTGISETNELECLDKTMPLKKRRTSSKMSKKEINFGKTGDMANEDELKPASSRPEIVSTDRHDNLGDAHVSEAPTMKKTRRNSPSKVESGFPRLQKHDKSHKDVPEPNRKSLVDSVTATRESEPFIVELFSSRRRRVSAKIPKKYSKATESGITGNGGLKNEQENKCEAKLPMSELIIQHENVKAVEEHVTPAEKVERSSSDASEVISQKSGKSRKISSDLSECTVNSVELSDKKGKLASNDLSRIDDGPRFSNNTLSASDDVSKSSSPSRSTVSGSEKRITKRRLSQTRSGNDLSAKRNHSPRAPKPTARKTLNSKELTECFEGSAQKGSKQKYSLDSAFGDSHLETIVEEKSDTQDSPKESKPAPLIFGQGGSISTDSQMGTPCRQAHELLNSSKEIQDSNGEGVSMISEGNNDVSAGKKGVESAAALCSTSDFKEKSGLKASGKCDKPDIKCPQKSSAGTPKVKATSTFPKVKVPTSPEPVDTSLDAKRMELKRLRESLGLDFSHTPRSVASTPSSNASGSPGLVSPKTPKASPGGVNLSKSSRTSSNSSTPPATITPKASEKFALLDWDSFIAKSQRKTRPQPVKTEPNKRSKSLVDMKIKAVITPKISPVEGKSTTESLSKEPDNSPAGAEKPTACTTPESQRKPKPKLQALETKISESANTSIDSESPLISEEPSLTSMSNAEEKSKSDLQDRGSISVVLTSTNSEKSVEDKIKEKSTEETEIEVESNSAIQGKENAVTLPDSRNQVLRESGDFKNDDGASESTVPCNGSDSDRESVQNDKMSMLSCPVCHLGGFATKAELKVHLTISCREEEPQKKKNVVKRRKRPIEWYCPGCPRSFGPFESAKALIDHLPTCHIKRVAFLNGESKTGKGKSRNVQLDPKDAPLWPAPLPSTPVTYGCPVCGCFFATASRLDQHRSEADHFHVVGRFLKTNGHLHSSK